jgi:hypothetical protein
MSAKREMKDCCIVTIGFVQVLMPATDGLKAMALLRNAVEVEHDMERGYGNWVAGERPRCEMQMVSPRNVRASVETPAPTARTRKPRLLGHEG